MSEKMTATDYKKNEIRERRKKERKYKHHLKELAEKIGYRSGAGSYDKDREYTNDEEHVAFYKKLWRRKDAIKFLKKRSNSKVRQNDDEELLQNGSYKKVDDIWWSYD